MGENIRILFVKFANQCLQCVINLNIKQIKPSSLAQ